MNTPLIFYTNIFLILSILIGYIDKVSGENNYYIISIRRSSKDKNYDDASQHVQLAIDELVNDRMNDIYDIISDNQDTYIQENGKQDEKLDELETSSQLNKRSNNNKKENKKFLFINKNRPQQQNIYKRSLNSTETENGEIKEYIPIESKLVNPICPVLNYYTVRAYLSEDIIKKIKKLPNVISYEKSVPSEIHGFDNKNIFNNMEIFYKKKQILKETRWNEVAVEEKKFDYNFKFSHLSLTSQGRVNDTTLYDNNYYYPSSAGKGIDIFLIDSGLNVALSEDDFTAEGERTISCDGEFYDGQYHPVPEDRILDCRVTNDIDHGTIVSAVAGGTVNGAAKKANIHMLATDYFSDNDLAALDYVKQHGKPFKTIINISRGYKGFIKMIKDKIDELVDSGIIIFVSAGNDSIDACNGNKYYSSYDNVIPVGATNNENIKKGMDDVYKLSDFSNFGECVTLFAPGYVKILSNSNEILLSSSGTSFSSPIVAGIAATIMSEHPEKNYNYQSIKEALINLSLKDAIDELDDQSPNRFINNGKKTVYQPPRCDDPSGLYKCQSGCCSRYGQCVNPKESSDSKLLCYIENGCQTEFGKCISSRCDSPFRERDCTEDECCSKDGKYINIFNDTNNYCFIENGCQNEFSSKCLSLNNDKYDEKYQDKIADFSCINELQPYEACGFEYDISWYTISYFVEQCESYEKSKCREFFKDPFKYAPSCKNAVKTHTYSLLNSLSPSQMEIRVAARNLICTRQNAQNPESMCLPAVMHYIYKVFPDKPHLEYNCGFNECYEATYILYEKLFYEYQNLYKNDTTYGYLYNVYGTYYYYLNSNECLSIRNQSLSTPKTEDIRSSSIKEMVTKTEKLVTSTKTIVSSTTTPSTITPSTTTPSTTSPSTEATVPTSEKISISTKIENINIPISTKTITTSAKTISKNITTSAKTKSINIPTSTKAISTSTITKSKYITTSIKTISKNITSSAKTISKNITSSAKTISKNITSSAKTISKNITSLAKTISKNITSSTKTKSSNIPSSTKIISTSTIFISKNIITSTKTKSINITTLTKIESKTISTSFKIISKKFSHPTKTISIKIPTSVVIGRCGPYFGICSEAGSCCNKYGYCGTSSDYCGDGCQVDFGRCSSTNLTTSKSSQTENGIPTSTVEGKCGPNYGACSEAGSCCSKYGYCGTSSDYCGGGCQSSYGICN